MTTLVAFILGGGPGVGLHTATALKAAGYRVALASRNPNTASLTALQIHPITLDLQDPASVAPAFAAVTAALGAPNIVVYNGYGLTFPPNPAEPTSLPLAALEKDTNVNTLSLYAAAQAAVTGWEQLQDGPKTLIYTGNVLPWMSMPVLLSLGVGKAASAHIIASLAKAYGARGWRFYFAYQVTEDGGVANSITPEAAAKVYAELAKEKEQGGWEVRFAGSGEVLGRAQGGYK